MLARHSDFLRILWMEASLLIRLVITLIGAFLKCQVLHLKKPQCYKLESSTRLRTCVFKKDPTCPKGFSGAAVFLLFLLQKSSSTTADLVFLISRASNHHCHLQPHNAYVIVLKGDRYIWITNIGTVGESRQQCQWQSCPCN